MGVDIGKMTLCEAAEGLRRGEFSSEALTRATLEGVARDIEGARGGEGSALGAFVSVDADAALAQARDADARRAKGETGALLGVPLAVKDLLSVKGQPCSCASKIMEGYVAPYDATVIARLRSAGAVFAGRTNMDEFAMGSTGESSALWPTRNPKARDRVAGGSSSGSAAAVAGGLAVAALGTDTGGSIRQPASFCGCVGLMPSYGRVSRFGVAALASSMDCVGTLTKTVEDAAALLTVLAGKDGNDPTTADVPVPDYREALKGATVKGLKIGLPKEYFTEDVDGAVMASVRAAVEAYRAMGAEVVEVSLPHADYAAATYMVLAAAEASANLAKFDGVRYGRRGACETWQEMYVKSRSEGFGDEVKRRLLLGTYVLTKGNYEAYYTRALKVRTLIRRDFAVAFTAADVLMSPVTPTAAYALRVAKDEGRVTKDEMYKGCVGDRFLLGANLAGLCGISLPCGATPDALPVGLQLLAPSMAEELLLKVAYAYMRGLCRQGERTHDA
ncbi:MAG: Asp-tRNA(Asn)/Glu-tRNA(Gln) amidotransferase subunit GatA [Kiritimatiellaeota bacterium]|nr:Asp-tRNA(Asn)/Glu-tRNA(Gln) amidotransferase subunit GatA [Kiritimatiellota bacterium]